MLKRILIAGAILTITLSAYAQFGQRRFGGGRQSGPSGGQWTLRCEDQRWTLWRGEQPAPTTCIRIEDHMAWKLLFNALSEDDSAGAVQIDGRTDLGRALLRARSVIV